jgi:hypothetical protein
MLIECCATTRRAERRRRVKNSAAAAANGEGVAGTSGHEAPLPEVTTPLPSNPSP